MAENILDVYIPLKSDQPRDVRDEHGFVSSFTSNESVISKIIAILSPPKANYDVIIVLNGLKGIITYVL